MTPQEMRARSGEKVEQVMSLITMLHLRIEVREKVTNEGFIEKIIYWIDEEKYIAAEVPVAPEAIAQEVDLPEEETV